MPAKELKNIGSGFVLGGPWLPQKCRAQRRILCISHQDPAISHPGRDGKYLFIISLFSAEGSQCIALMVLLLPPLPGTAERPLHRSGVYGYGASARSRRYDQGKLILIQDGGEGLPNRLPLRLSFEIALG